ncbi:hypothetical protein D3C84_941930 [compost metagenome]
MPGALETPCGSGLARESGGSGDISVNGSTVIASRLTPTFDRCHAQDLCSLQIPCGSLLAKAVYGSHGNRRLFANHPANHLHQGLSHWRVQASMAISQADRPGGLFQFHWQNAQLAGGDFLFQLMRGHRREHVRAQQ